MKLIQLALNYLSFSSVTQAQENYEIQVYGSEFKAGYGISLQDPADGSIAKLILGKRF